MSMLSKLGRGVGHVVSTNVRGAGRTMEKYGAPITAGILAASGVGLPAAAAILAAQQGMSSLAAGRNLKHTVGQAVKGAVQGGGAAGLGQIAGGAIKAIPGAANLPGVQSIGNLLGKAKGALSSVPGADKIGGVVNTVKGAARAANGGKPITLGTLGSLLGKGASTLASHPELAAAGLSGVAGYRDAKRGGQLENDAINTMRGAYNSLDPNKPHEDLSALFADPGNPYVQAKKIRLSGAH